MVWRKKRLLALMMFAMLIATLFVIRKVPNRYESSALIVIGNKMTEETRAKYATSVSTKMEQLTSRANLAVMVRKYDLYPTIVRTEDAVAKLSKDLVTQVNNASVFPNLPESIKITYRHTVPQKAYQVVNEIAQSFEQENFQVRQEALGESQRLATQILEAQERLKSLGPISDQTLLLGLGRPGESGLSARMQQETLQSTVDSLSDRKYLLEKQIEAKEREIAEQEKTVRQLAAAPKSAANPALGPLITRKAEIEGNIKTYADKYTDKHPQMVQWRNQIVEINRQIERLDATVAGGGAAAANPQEVRELRTMQSDLGKLRNELEITDREIQRKNLSLQKMAAAPVDERRAGRPRAGRCDAEGRSVGPGRARDADEPLLMAAEQAGGGDEARRSEWFGYEGLCDRRCAEHAAVSGRAEPADAAADRARNRPRVRAADRVRRRDSEVFPDQRRAGHRVLPRRARAGGHSGDDDPDRAEPEAEGADDAGRAAADAGGGPRPGHHSDFESFPDLPDAGEQIAIRQTHGGRNANSSNRLRPRDL